MTIPWITRCWLFNYYVEDIPERGAYLRELAREMGLAETRASGSVPGASGALMKAGMRMNKRLTKSQRAAMLDILRDVNADEITSQRAVLERFAEDGLPAWLLDWPLWSAGENMPGYMPDTPYCLFLTERAARGYCREMDHSDDYVTDMMPVSLREVLPRS